MPSISERYGKRKGGFFRADDVRGNSDVILQISSVDFDQQVGDKNADIVRFKNDERSLILNQTNAQTIASLHGDDTDEWIGKWITLFFDPEVEYFGKKEGGVRVRPAAPERPSVAKELDDAIPF